MSTSLNDLKYFVEVATKLNLSRASERLGISQPSLTVAIQRLEKTIGAVLFTRNRKGVFLTPAGKQALSHARQLIQSWEVLKNSALASELEVQGTYRVGCHSTIASYVLPKFIPKFLDQYRQIELQLIHDLSRKITEGVIDMRIDLGIVVNPVRHQDLVIKKIYSDKVTFWVGDGKSKIQDPTSGEAVLIYDPDLLQAQALIKRLKESDIRYRRLVTSSSLEVITSLAASGAGIAILPTQVALSSKTLGLRVVEKAPTFEDEICLVYRMEQKNVKTIQKIVAEILALFRK